MADETKTSETQASPVTGVPAPVMPPKPLEVVRPEVVRPEIHSAARPAGDMDARKLIVGRGIELTGNIGSCDKVIVEGRVEANLKDCSEIEVAASGMFKGEAEIKTADISGNYEGTLTAHDILVVRSSGRVQGTIRFGRLEVERGGQITGDIAPQAAGGNN